MNNSKIGWTDDTRSGNSLVCQLTIAHTGTTNEASPGGGTPGLPGLQEIGTATELRSEAMSQSKHTHSQQRKSVRFGPANNMWKGGRSVASNGYVLIRVGIDHHLADVRGYAYEHRIEAEKKFGRRLVTGEMVHHIDGNKQNNAHSNLEIVANGAEHLLLHRKPGSKRRLPNESNPLLRCACGCERIFRKFDKWNRPRAYVAGHNPEAVSNRAKNIN